MKKKKMTRVEYQKRLRRKRMRLKPVPFAILILICSSIFIFSLYSLVTWQLDNNKIKNLHSEIDDISNGEFIKDKGDAFNPPDDKDSDYWYYIDLPFYNVDFDELLKKNKDTVAFIHMENNNINYPVVQSKDNNYYLTHAFDKSYNEAGWVFLDYRNNINSLSFNNIIYGHGRLNKTVFGKNSTDLTVYGYAGSTAETYANDNEFEFIEIKKTEITGDLDSDGEITSSDALNILQLVVSGENLTDEQKKLADMDGDGEITSADALYILQMVVGLR